MHINEISYCKTCSCWRSTVTVLHGCRWNCKVQEHPWAATIPLSGLHAGRLDLKKLLKPHIFWWLLPGWRHSLTVAKMAIPSPLHKYPSLSSKKVKLWMFLTYSKMLLLLLLLQWFCTFTKILQCFWHNCCFSMSSASVSSKKGLLTSFFCCKIGSTSIHTKSF